MVEMFPKRVVTFACSAAMSVYIVPTLIFPTVVLSEEYWFYKFVIFVACPLT